MAELLPGLGDMRIFNSPTGRAERGGDSDVSYAYAAGYSRTAPHEYVEWMRPDGRGVTFLAGRVFERHGAAL